MASLVGLVRQIRHGFRTLFDRRTADRDLHDEVDHYLEQTARVHQARGLSAAEARRAARVEVGNPTVVKEEVRSYGWENAVDTLLADLRYAGRRLRSAPGFTTVTVLTLALGIGATTAIFSAINPILLKSLPYPDPDRLMLVWESGADGTRSDPTFQAYRAVAERTPSFAALTVARSWQPTLTGGDLPEQLEGQRVGFAYFRVLGVAPVLGTDFDAAQDRPGGARLAILSDQLWRRRFGADRSVVGSSITLNDDPYLVVGVMPPTFENLLAPAAQIWTLLQYDLDGGRSWGHHLRMVGRLGPGISAGQAGRELAVVAPDLDRLAKSANEYFAGGFAVEPLQTEITRAVQGALFAILGAVLLVLVIACVNVTNLLLARGAHRRGELAVRATLGAGRGRLIRQLLTESLLLALLGGLGGMVVAFWGVRALIALAPPDLPRVGAIAVDGSVFAFGLVMTTVVGVAFGIIPALKAVGADRHAGFQGSSRRSVGGNPRTRSALVVAEVALALVLLASSGLLLRSLGRLLAVDVGFDSTRILTMQVQVSGRRFAADSVTYRFFGSALEAVRRVPGVVSAGLTSQLPLSGDLDQYGAHFAPTPGEQPVSANVFRYAVSPGYLETMRIPIRRGRGIEEQDRAGAPAVALISESLAERRFPGGNPIGRQLRIGAADGPPLTIAGVVGNVRQSSLGSSESDAVYLPAVQGVFADSRMSLTLRVRGNPPAIAAAAREAIWSVDRNQVIHRVATMDELVASSVASRRFSLILFEAFALAALVLAAAGIYGVLAATVAERTREIGVRSALGASRGRTVGLVVRQGVGLALIGIVVGLVGALLASRGIAGMLYGISRLDPVTYVGVIVLLVGVALVASGVPAWRAARIDPAVALQAE